MKAVEDVEVGQKDQDEDEEDEEEEEDEGDAQAKMSEKLFAVRNYLQELPGHPFVSFTDLDNALQIDLNMEDELLERLGKSEMILVDTGNSRIKFQPRINVRDLQSLLRELKRFPDGLSITEIEVSGPANISQELEKAVVMGLVIAVRNRNKSAGSSPLVIFPRGESFLVPLSGTFNVPENKSVLESSQDVTMEVRRGDAFVIGEDAVDGFLDDDVAKIQSRCVRVSNEPFSSSGGSSISDVFESIRRTGTPYSRSSSKEAPVPKEGDYFEVFGDSKVPFAPRLDKLHAMNGIKVFKHGCTNDVKKIWKNVTKRYRFRAEDKASLDRLLLDNNLSTTEDLEKAAQATRVNRAPLKKRRRVGNRRRNLTNAHLDE